jgi:P2 family phage contractile tail tube protein
MALPSIVRDINCFIKNKSFVGIANVATLPKIVTKTTDMVLAGFAGDVERDIGKLEKLESSITISQYSSEVLGLIGDRASRDETLVLRGAIDTGDDISTLVVSMQGLWKEVEFGEFKPETEVTTKFAICVEVFTLELDSKEIIHIDKENNIFRVNGIDRNTKIREALAQ